MMKKMVVGLLVLCMSFGLSGIVNAAYGAKERLMPPETMITVSKSELDLRDNMRKLWSNHVFWTRLYVVSSVANQSDSGLNKERLLKNPEYIGNALKPYYGNDAGERLTLLLKDHILISADIIALSKKGEMTAVTERENKWMANADAIAMFLNEINPHWEVNEMKNLLLEHLDLSKGELTARLNDSQLSDILTFDKIYTQALVVADAMTDGIVKQYPTMFGQ